MVRGESCKVLVSPHLLSQTLDLFYLILHSPSSTAKKIKIKNMQKPNTTENQRWDELQRKQTSGWNSDSSSNSSSNNNNNNNDENKFIGKSKSDSKMKGKVVTQDDSSKYFNETNKKCSNIAYK